ncbi:MAG: hypothetical protein HYZ94_03850 [Candidatus Omnitrophica bacterium]|nr:hypothetical protein [Candidatus Omnitrophota bacterium]
MSLIADALRKADSTSPSGPTPPSPSSLWVYRALLLGSVVVIGAGAAAVAKRRAPAAAARPAAAAVAASRPRPAGIQLLRTAQRDMDLNGIVRGGPGRPLALINGEVVEEGGRVRGAQLVRIGDDSVQLEENGQLRTLKLE